MAQSRATAVIVLRASRGRSTTLAKPRIRSCKRERAVDYRSAHTSSGNGSRDIATLETPQPYETAARAAFGVALLGLSSWLVVSENDENHSSCRAAKHVAEESDNGKKSASSPSTKPPSSVPTGDSESGNVGLLSDSKRSDYVIKGRLGFGGFAHVARGVQKTSGRLVAIKEMPKSMTTFRKFAMEAGILQDCGGKDNVIGFYDAFQTEDSWVMVTELAEGGELFDRMIEQGAYSEKDAAQLARAVCRSLKHLHDQGVVHGDLKPENVVLTSYQPDAEIRLVDFGLAFRFRKTPKGGISIDKASLPGPVSGTVAYAAPEVLAGRPSGPSQDIWSLGVVVYILLCGVHPFDPDNVLSDSSIEQRIRKGQYDTKNPMWKQLSPQAKDLIKRMLAPSPPERPSAEEVLSHSWCKPIDNKAPTEPLEHAAERLAKYQRGHRRLKATLLSLLLKDSATKLSTDGILSPRASMDGSKILPSEGFKEGQESNQGEFSVSGWDSLVQMLDQAGKGYVDREDLRHFLQGVGVDISEIEVDEMLRASDGDPDTSPLSIPYKQLEALGRGFGIQAMTWKEGDEIVKEGESSRLVYRLVDGKVECSRMPYDGHDPIVFDSIQNGDHFGGYDVLDDVGSEQKRLCTCRCVSKMCSALTIDGRELASLKDVSEAVHERYKKGQRERLQARVISYMRALKNSKEVEHRTYEPGEIIYVSSQGVWRKEADGEDDSWSYDMSDRLNGSDDAFYLIKDGEVEVLHDKDGGDSIVIEHLRSGDFFPLDIAKSVRGGRMASDGRQSTDKDKVERVRTITPVSVVRIEGDSFREFLRTYDIVADNFYQQTIKRDDERARLALSAASLVLNDKTTEREGERCSDSPRTVTAFAH